MPYVVLARKYRPPNFDSLVGQEHVVQALANALTQQRLHHAYLFTGTRGVGKTTISRILAKSLNCTGVDGQGGITAHPCGVCDACRDIDMGRFIDYVELDAASNRGVDEISQLLDQAVYKPVLGRFKVYLIDEVHMLTTHAFNAMLKTLEEPPEYLKFVLATTDPQKVPPTVLSRCLQFNLRPMAPQTVQEHLERVLAQEHIEAEPAALRLLARAARGSMRDALSLTDQAIAFGAGRLEEAGVRQMLGAVDRGHAVRMTQALAAGDGPALVAAADGLRALGLSASGALEELAALLQQMAVLQAVPAAADLADVEAAAVARLSGLLAADDIQLFYSIALHGRAELGLAPDEYSGLVMVLLRMLAFRPPGSAKGPTQVQSATTQVEQKEKATSMVTAMAANLAPTPTPTPTPPTPALAGARANGKPRSVSLVSSEPPPWLDVPFDADELSSSPTPEQAEREPALPAPAPARSPAPSRAEFQDTAPPAAAPTAFGDRWARVVRQMQDAGGIAALTRELAIQAQCIAIDDSAVPPLWRLRVERDNLRAPAHADKLRAALAEVLGQPVRLELEAGVAHDTPSQREAADRNRRQAEAEQIIHNDPLVRALMAEYKSARIVPGSVKPH